MAEYPIAQLLPEMQAALARLAELTLVRPDEHLHLWTCVLPNARPPAGGPTNAGPAGHTGWVSLHAALPPVPVTMPPSDTPHYVALGALLKGIELLLVARLGARPLHVYVDSWYAFNSATGRVAWHARRGHLAATLRARLGEWRAATRVQRVKAGDFAAHPQASTIAPSLLEMIAAAQT